MGAAVTGTLTGLKVLDMTDERAIYGAKLLADLGAEVLRPQGAQGDPLCLRGPFDRAAQESLWYAYFASSRTVVHDADSDPARLLELIGSADVLLWCDSPLTRDLPDPTTLSERFAHLIVIDVSSFGRFGPWQDYLAPDLVAGALGGAAATTGDVDTPPLKAFGELNFMVSGVYVAIAALAGVYARSEGGGGQRVGVSVHETLVSCLEQVLMFYWYGEAMGRERVLPRRGALHWSNAYAVLNGVDGSIMVTPTPNFDRQLVWLIEEGVHDDLIDPKYSEPENLGLRIERTMQILTEWVAGKEVEALFLEGQARHSPYGQVLPIEKVADNPQLAARDWFAAYAVGEREVQGPGAPYHFSATPWEMRSSTSVVLADAAWESPATPPIAPLDPPAARPLEGLKVLDFSHVLAGPFATRVLADMGADVIKINSASRAEGANEPAHPYYLMWNRNKRALALDLTQTDGRDVCRALCEQADVVIDNFSVGVLDRLGVGYEAVNETNPKVIYVQMSGMGDGGPWSDFVTYAPTIHALAGLTHMTGVGERQDIGIGFSYNDHQAGLHGALAILAALYHRRGSGRGQRVDISQFEVGVNFAGPALLDFFANGVAARPVGNQLPFDQACPHNVYRCAPAGEVPIEAQRWLAIACMNDAQWRSLAAVLETGWAADDELADVAGRLARREDIDAELAAWCADQDAYAAMARLQAAGVPAGVVQDGVDLAERDPQLDGARFLRKLDDIHERLGQSYVDTLPIDFARQPCEDYVRSKDLGEDSAAVLADWLGYGQDEIDALAAKGLLS